MRYILEVDGEHSIEDIEKRFDSVEEIRPGLYKVESPEAFETEPLHRQLAGVPGKCVLIEDEEVHIMREPLIDPPLTGDDIEHLDAIRPFLETAIKEIGADQAHQRGLTGAGVKIAIIDTGVDANHEAFILESGKSKVIKRLDFTDDENEDHYHGTHVAGIAASCHVLRPGVAPDADIIDVRVLDSTGRGWTSNIIKGIRAAAQAGAHVLNMSLGSSNPSDGTDILSKEVNLVSDTYGVVIVVAAGNSGGPVGSPAAAETAITVGATAGEAIASFSSFNGLVDKPDVVAPGVSINSAEPGNKWGRHSGTSMATPFVAGFCALIISNDPYTAYGVEMIKTSVMRCTKALDEPREKQGTGKIWIPKYFEDFPPQKCPWCHTQNSADHKEPCHNQNDIPANWSAWKLIKLAIKKIFE